MRGFPAFAASLLLAAGVAAAVSAVTARIALERVPGVASVRLGRLTADYMAGAVREGGDREAAVDAREWARRLEDALARTAARRGVVLLTAGAVAAGGEDLTAEVEAAMAAAVPRGIPRRKGRRIKQ